jgi:hypothetical protein
LVWNEQPALWLRACRAEQLVELPANFLQCGAAPHFTKKEATMNAVVVGGPYDGITVDHNDINLYCSVHGIGFRNFIFFPPRDQWEAVKREEVSKGELRSLLAYELVRLPTGIELHFDGEGQRMNEARSQEANGIHPPIPQFSGMYFQCVPDTEANLEAMISVNPTRTVDDKGRPWLCIPLSQEAGETSPSPSSVFQFGRIAIQHCNDPSELPAKLANILD